MFTICDNIRFNFEKIKGRPSKSLKYQPFINNYNWKVINIHQKLKNRKIFEKNNPTKLPIIHTLEKEICLVIFQKLIQIVKNK